MGTQNIFAYELKDIPVNLIDVGDRKRKDFGDIAALAADISQFGLHTTITVLEKACVEGLADHTDDGLDPSKPYLLLAGERRLRAVRSLKWAEISAKIVQREMDEWEIRVIELHENLQRKSMTPAEEGILTDEIHNLYQGIYGKAEPGPNNEGHGIRDTAKILGKSPATVSDSLEIASYVEVIPELKEAKTKSEAKKMIKALKEKLVREEIAKREEARKRTNGKSHTSTTEKRKSILMQRYILGDFFEQIKGVETRTIDLVELDPDWGILFKERVKATGSLTADDYDTLQPEDYEAGLTEMAKELFRVMKDHSWLICWYSIEEWHNQTRDILNAAGFSVCGMPAFWIHTSNKTGTPAYRLGQRTESFFYARKGNARIGKMGHPNTFTYRTLNQDERKHPAEKPIELYTDIFSTFLGERKAASILIPFAGSGNSILAADNLEHNAIGFDTSKKFRDDYIIKVEQGTPGQYHSYRS